MQEDQLKGIQTGVMSDAEDGLIIRSYRPVDHLDVSRLYRTGLLAGQLDPTDRALDLDDIKGAYFCRPENHFWVAEAKRSVIGMVALSEDDNRITHLRRLRVEPSWQLDRRVAIGLIRTAISHSRVHGCLKLIFHTSLGGPDAAELLHGLGLQLTRIRNVEGRHLVEFYDNLYASSGANATAEATRTDDFRQL